ncbi:MAG: hypothetical protein ACI396_07400 [Acutalibacteraceae bacterium]
MRALTFNGFLSSYVKDLSGENTLNIRRLAKQAEESNPRLVEPLILYSYFNVKPQQARVQLVNSSLFDEYVSFTHLHSDKEETLHYLEYYSTIPDNYQKVYKSYLTKANANEVDNEVKEKMRVKIISLQEQKNVSAYSLVKSESLSLNKGNYYGFLRGNTKLLSLETIDRVLGYLLKL